MKAQDLRKESIFHGCQTFFMGMRYRFFRNPSLFCFYSGQTPRQKQHETYAYKTVGFSAVFIFPSMHSDLYENIRFDGHVRIKPVRHSVCFPFLQWIAHHTPVLEQYVFCAVPVLGMYYPVCAADVF